MAEENDANIANYEELAGHIKILGAKLKQCVPQQSDNIENLEDYYDRALQMRVMRNVTLEEELQEEKTKVDKIQTSLNRVKIVAAIIVVLMGLAGAIILYPDKMEKMLASTELWTHVVLFFSAVYITKKLL